MKKNYFKSLISGIICLTFGLSHSQNILTDGDFSLTNEVILFDTPTPPSNVWAYWVNYWGNGSEANPTIVDGVCNFQIINPGYNTWDIQLAQWGFPLIQGHTYRLMFDVKADAYRSFGVFLGEDGGNYTSLIGYNQYFQNATTEWQTYSLDFEAFSIFPLHKLSFELGTDNTTTYFDNIVLIDLGVQEHSIGILGSALNGWDEDVDMESSDGIYYTLTNYPLSQGEAKFRQDNSWDINWGASDFPSGIAYSFGPNIPIPYAANYNITFNMFSGEYVFECVSNCPIDIGIIGSALNGWDEDVDMITADGITYFLNDYFFTTGEAKFRQDNSWDINWGNDTFPSGVAFQNGPNIPVQEGTYNVSFNRETGDYSFSSPSIGIIGSALSGWTDDIDMQTEDGTTYTLENYYFNSGEAKFRQDNSWSLNWGGDTFPSGVAFFNGPNIPILEGTYIVTFNRFTGDYNFVATTCPNPEIQCPFDIYVENSIGMCGAYVSYPEVIPAANCGGEGITIVQTAGLPSGSFFPIGTTTNTFVLTNVSGAETTCSFNVTVFDIEPPVIADLNEIYEPLWPANHKMVQVFIEYVVMDNCGNTTTKLFITSNEAENGLGDGDKAPDWEILDEHNVLLRAERSGKGDGRDYYITIMALDDSGNYSDRQVIVKVPHDQSVIKEFNNSDIKDKGFILFPNGVDTVINIKGLKFSENASYDIYNMFGEVKGNGILKNNKIDVRTLPQGIYILKFKTEEGNFFKKFIKN